MREFTEEQRRAGLNTLSRQTAGAHGIMERSALDTSKDITFGRDQVE